MGRALRHRVGFAIVVLGSVFLAGCQGVTPALACKVQVDTPALISDRTSAGIADCDWGNQAGTKADLPDLKLDCLGGETPRSLRDVRGPAMLNFWASNCGPCRKEMPVLEEFSKKYGDQVAVIGVNYLDLQPEMAIDLARRTGVTYPSVADPCGDLQKTDAPLGRGLPFFLFVAADGSVSDPHSGGVTRLSEVVDLAAKYLDVDVEAVRKGLKGAERGASRE
ncbi:MAG: TlpA family protein disulfide reductase [Nocardioidaceae bacterium]|nr:TlpA family protein disulfide reductase [Nocardioidaceae bacterium]